ncbi:MAG: glycosyltransferase family 9 protein [Acetobacteraceae bacterium]
MKNILVLKLGALGNIVLSLAAFAAIRQHHPDARITLLTTAPYADWMAASPWFDRVLIDTRPAWWDLPGVLRLRRMLRGGDFDRVYDLQTSSRSSHYFRLFPRAARPEWSGIAPGCSHPDRDPDRDRIHDIDRQHGQLRQAGIADIPPADLSWCRGDIARFALPRPFALLVPGSAPHRPVKRWPAAHYRALAGWLIAQGIAPVVLGTAGERRLADEICAGATNPGAGGSAHGVGTSAQSGNAPAQGAGATGHRTDMAIREVGAHDLTGQTGFGDLADLGRAAIMAIGNDTGPMHLLATAGCPSLVLFSGDSDPARCAPRAPPGAPRVRVLRRHDLATLTPAEVITEVATAMGNREDAALRADLPASAKATA